MVASGHALTGGGRDNSGQICTDEYYKTSYMFIKTMSRCVTQLRQGAACAEPGDWRDAIVNRANKQTLTLPEKACTKVIVWASPASVNE